jgi:uncharacterized protein YaeQ
VALTATIYTFDVQLADVDRGVYESLALRVARQPSETDLRRPAGHAPPGVTAGAP